MEERFFYISKEQYDFIRENDLKFNCYFSEVTESIGKGPKLYSFKCQLKDFIYFENIFKNIK